MVSNKQRLHDSGNISRLTDHLFRHEAGKMVAVLVRIFGTENLELAEDVVQDTFVAAMRTWPLKGIPQNPSAWLFRAAKNKAVDVVRRNKFSRQYDFSQAGNPLLESEYTLSAAIDAIWNEESIPDDLLRMMFACSHPGISPENQITLMLKTLCGFSVTEIAKAFLTSEETISKRLYRTREFLRKKKLRPEFPATAELKGRTDAVLRAVYLLFNEGYNATDNDELIRRDLLQHAMYLCRLLCDSPHVQMPEVHAAMGLMCFHAARINSRLNQDGEIILLARQDRSKWDPDLIREGNDFMNKAASGDVVSTYHLEAAIAYEHCIAASFEETNWQRILECYDWLVRINPTPVTHLNRLAVVYSISGAEKVLSEIASSSLKGLEDHYLYHSLLGELYSKIDVCKAREAYERAIQLTKSKVEKKLLTGKLEGLQYYKWNPY